MAGNDESSPPDESNSRKRDAELLQAIAVYQKVVRGMLKIYGFLNQRVTEHFTIEETKLTVTFRKVVTDRATKPLISSINDLHMLRAADRDFPITDWSLQTYRYLLGFLGGKTGDYFSTYKLGAAQPTAPSAAQPGSPAGDVASAAGAADGRLSCLRLPLDKLERRVDLIQALVKCLATVNPTSTSLDDYAFAALLLTPIHVLEDMLQNRRTLYLLRHTLGLSDTPDPGSVRNAMRLLGTDTQPCSIKLERDVSDDEKDEIRELADRLQIAFPREERESLLESLAQHPFPLMEDGRGRSCCCLQRPELRPRVLVINISLSMAGLNLHRCCSRGTILQYPWNYWALFQVICPLVRMMHEELVIWMCRKIVPETLFTGGIPDWLCLSMLSIVITCEILCLSVPAQHEHRVTKGILHIFQGIPTEAVWKTWRCAAKDIRDRTTSSFSLNICRLTSRNVPFIKYTPPALPSSRWASPGPVRSRQCHCID
ncbi:uncharacterized protein B0T15DRAFT_570459 [Chaetomium strumarium]|uniref:Uncharacterized protein n=1 Tax=Chaetomium strumarium TaxID=1170767 RepID=A0AAJ0H0U4_9PEZI|nr:hypothetical protein B0T15DRAFT_570459 [Chaetomium strumarium]